MLVACNKSDLTSARTEKFIVRAFDWASVDRFAQDAFCLGPLLVSQLKVEEIEREIEQMRVSRAATLEGQDQADSGALEGHGLDHAEAPSPFRNSGKLRLPGCRWRKVQASGLVARKHTPVSCAALGLPRPP